MGKQWKQWQTLFCCCCYCKVASVMSDSVRPQRQQPTRLPRAWDSPGKNTGVGCHFLLQCMKVKSESEVAQSCPILAIPWTTTYQAPPSMGFSRQKYWSGVPLPSLKYSCKSSYKNPLFNIHKKTTLDTQKLERKIYKRKSANHKGQD